MRAKGKIWVRDELILALNVYCKLPFGKIHSRNPMVIRLAAFLGRTPSSVALKLVNFASLDSSLSQKGMANCSSLDNSVWDEFFSQSKIISESEKVYRTVFEERPGDEAATDYSAGEKSVNANVRLMQGFFRKTILNIYDTKCCITGISIPELLVASHIVPWKKDRNNRLNPCNGLCLNALHDKAFDKGFITISDKYEIVVSRQIENIPENNFIADSDRRKISLPDRFLPAREFLEYHRTQIYRG